MIVTAPLNHCEPELVSLELLRECQQLLTRAIDSLGDKTPPTQEANYIFAPAVGINRLADGYLVLRKEFRVHASKLLVRPAVELLIYASAATKSKEFHFRKAYTEWLEDKKFSAKTAADEDAAEKALVDLEREFAARLPGYPAKRERLSIKQAAAMAELGWLYERQFSIYCQFTHGSLRALTGALDAETDHRDTNTVCWCTMIMIDLLRVHTPAIIPDMIPYRKRLLAGSGLEAPRT